MHAEPLVCDLCEKADENGAGGYLCAGCAKQALECEDMHVSVDSPHYKALARDAWRWRNAHGWDPMEDWQEHATPGTAPSRSDVERLAEGRAKYAAGYREKWLRCMDLVKRAFPLVACAPEQYPSEVGSTGRDEWLGDARDALRAPLVKHIHPCPLDEEDYFHNPDAKCACPRTREERFRARLAEAAGRILDLPVPDGRDGDSWRAALHSAAYELARTRAPE